MELSSYLSFAQLAATKLYLINIIYLHVTYSGLLISKPLSSKACSMVINAENDIHIHISTLMAIIKSSQQRKPKTTSIKKYLNSFIVEKPNNNNIDHRGNIFISHRQHGVHQRVVFLL